MSTELRAEKNCLNCGHFVPDHFCSHCGQENIKTKETFSHQISHVIGDITHFDSKFLSTIKYLFIKPGFLTLEYLKGKRVRYVHPVKLFVFTSFLFFLLYGLIPDLHTNTNKHDNSSFSDFALKKSLENAETKKDSQEILNYYNNGKDFGHQLAKNKDSINNISEEENHIDAFKDGEKTIQNIFDETKKQADTSIENITINDGGFIRFESNDSDSINKLTNTFDRHLTTIENYNKEQDSLPVNKRDGYFTKKLKLLAINNKEKPASEFVHEFVEKFMHSMHYWIYLLFPFFALILKFVYRKKNFYYAEHLVFGFHIHTIALLLLLLNFSIKRLLNIDITDWILFGFFLYLFLSLKRLYNDSYIKTFFKAILIYLFYGFFVLIFIVLGMASLIFI